MLVPASGDFREPHPAIVTAVSGQAINCTGFPDGSAPRLHQRIPHVSWKAPAFDEGFVPSSPYRWQELDRG